MASDGRHLRRACHTLIRGSVARVRVCLQSQASTLPLSTQQEPQRLQHGHVILPRYCSKPHSTLAENSSLNLHAFNVSLSMSHHRILPPPEASTSQVLHIEATHCALATTPFSMPLILRPMHAAR